MRRTKYFTCGKCGALNPDFLTFRVGFGPRARYYCLGHIPWSVRVRMQLRERLGRAA